MKVDNLILIVRKTTVIYVIDYVLYINNIVENTELGEDDLRSPGAIIAENVRQDLLTSFDRLRNEMHLEDLELVKPTLVARFGKILFHG